MRLLLSRPLVPLVLAVALLFAFFAYSRLSTGSVNILTAVAASQTPEYEMFLKLDTIGGGSTDTKHRDEIVIDSFTWGETRSLGATRPTMDGLTVTLPTGKASPRLFLYTAGGLKISRGVLAVRRAGTADDFLTWTLTDAQIVSYKTVGNTHGDGVQDQIVIVPGKIEVALKPSDGSGVQKAGWDMRTGKSVGY